METAFKVPPATNEPPNSFAPGSAPRVALVSALGQMAGEVGDIPCIIGGKSVFTGRLMPVVMPHNHRHTLAQFHAAAEPEAELALQACARVRAEWRATPWQQRLAVFLKAAELVSTRHRA